MRGISADTGKAIDGLDHLRQSIRDILTTPLGSRVMRRDYGSRLLRLVDRPTTQGLMVELYAATAEALARWEPRFALDEVRYDTISASGHISLTISGRYRPTGKPVTLEGIIL